MNGDLWTWRAVKPAGLFGIEPPPSPDVSWAKQRAERWLVPSEPGCVAILYRGDPTGCNWKPVEACHVVDGKPEWWPLATVMQQGA